MAHHNKFKYKNHTRFLYFRSTMNLYLIDTLVKKLLHPIIKKCIEFKVPCQNILKKLNKIKSKVKIPAHQKAFKKALKRIQPLFRGNGNILGTMEQLQNDDEDLDDAEAFN